ncbi:fimbria/pilus outer membrane usher protein [bacterium]|nr:fimbria/pilus outer membrane usher protein [bacterium]
MELLLLALGSLVLADVPNGDDILLRVFLNEVDKGDFFLLMTPDSDLLFSEEQFQQFGLQLKGRIVKVRQKECVSLRSLEPMVQYEIEKGSILRITAEPQVFYKSFVDLSQRETKTILQTRDTAAFLNYSLRYSGTDSVSVWNVPGELALSKAGSLAITGFSLTKEHKELRFVRLTSQITWDDVKRNNRLTLGDFSAFSGTLGGVGTLGGISFSRNYSATPHFIKTPGFDFEGLLATSSEVQIYLNRQLIKTMNLGPGQFQFANLQSSTGSGEVMVVIKDAFGREQVLLLPFYLSSSLLKPGLHDFSYNAGWIRQNLGKASFDYRDPAFAGFHQYGFSSAFTAGFRAEADSNTINFGPTATFLIFNAGEISASGAYSRQAGKKGFGASLTYKFFGRKWGAHASIQTTSPEYANLSSDGERNSVRLRELAGFSFYPRSLGSFSFTLSRTTKYDSPESREFSVSFSRPLGRTASIVVSANRNREFRVTHEFFAGVNFFFDGNRSANIQYRHQNGRDRITGMISQNAPRGPGIGYRVSAEAEPRGDPGAIMNFQHKSTYGISSFDYQVQEGVDTYTLGYSGSISFINRSFHLSRPITDSFALVQVGNIKNVDVYYASEKIGSTRSNGELIVPEMVSYFENPVSIDEKDIPVNYTITELQEVVSPPLRGGSIMKFDVQRLQGFEGRLFFLDGAIKRPAEFAAFSLQVEGAIRQFTVGKGGQFYLENLTPGKYAADLVLEGQKCSLEVVIPDREDIIVDLEDYFCGQ